MIEIQLNSPVPIYEQLMTQLRSEIETGALQPGDRLPPIRVLASQLDVAVNTVARAYSELEREGLIVSNGRKGSYVRETGDVTGGQEGRELKTAIITLLQKGMDREDIERIFHANLNQIFR